MLADAADAASIFSAQSIALAFDTYFVNVGKLLAEKFVAEPYTANVIVCHSPFTLHAISKDIVSGSMSS